MKPPIFVSIVNRIITVFSFLALLLLCLLSLFWTATMAPDISEITIFQKQNPVFLVLFLFLCALVLPLIAFRFKKQFVSLLYKKYQKYYYAFLFLFCLFWVLCFQDIPGRDQGEIQLIASSLARGDYSVCAQGTYVDAYPFQLGLIWFSVFVQLVFGPTNYLALAVINILALLLIYKSLLNIMELFSFPKKSIAAFYFISFLFVPLMLYCSFLYGTLLGLAFSFLCIYFLLSYYKKKKVSSFLMATTCGTLAVILKPNYQIIIIATTIASILYAILKCQPKILILPFCIVVTSVFLSEGVLAGTRIISNCDIGQGSPSVISHLALGTSEGGGAPGWYNGQNDPRAMYTNNGYNTKKTAEKSFECFSKNINKLYNNPRYAFDFFEKKMVSQWCNPDFQSYWNIAVDKSLTQRPDWLKVLFESPLFLFCEKCFQVYIYLFSLFAICLSKKSNPLFLVFSLSFLGGFFCFVLWEGKCQYTIPFFVCLFPYAAYGFSIWCDIVHSWFSKIKRHSH